MLSQRPQDYPVASSKRPIVRYGVQWSLEGGAPRKIHHYFPFGAPTSLVNSKSELHPELSPQDIAIIQRTLPPLPQPFEAPASGYLPSHLGTQSQVVGSVFPRGALSLPPLRADHRLYITPPPANLSSSQESVRTSRPKPSSHLPPLPPSFQQAVHLAGDANRKGDLAGGTRTHFQKKHDVPRPAVPESGGQHSYPFSDRSRSPRPRFPDPSFDDGWVPPPPPRPRKPPCSSVEPQAPIGASLTAAGIPPLKTDVASFRSYPEPWDLDPQWRPPPPPLPKNRRQNQGHASMPLSSGGVGFANDLAPRSPELSTRSVPSQSASGDALKVTEGTSVTTGTINRARKRKTRESQNTELSPPFSRTAVPKMSRLHHNPPPAESSGSSVPRNTSSQAASSGSSSRSRPPQEPSKYNSGSFPTSFESAHSSFRSQRSCSNGLSISHPRSSSETTSRRCSGELSQPRRSSEQEGIPLVSGGSVQTPVVATFSESDVPSSSSVFQAGGCAQRTARAGCGTVSSPHEAPQTVFPYPAPTRTQSPQRVGANFSCSEHGSLHYKTGRTAP